MTQELDSDIIIIGAGPSGLTAGYELARNGIKAEILEQTDRIGGLMRSIPRGEFMLDIGRKEMYTRIPEMAALWDELLGSDYRVYPHRVGSLHGGRIVELSGQFRGLLRGVPMPVLLRGGMSLIRGRLNGLLRQPQSYQDHWHFRVGEVFSRLFAQGYWEKFRGTGWANMPVPAADPEAPRASYSQKAVGGALRLAVGTDDDSRVWRHPRLGTGQLFNRLEEEIVRAGGEIRFGTEVNRITELPGGGWRLDVTRDGKEQSISTSRVISSLSVEALSERLYRGDTPLLRRRARVNGPALYETRHVVLVYLFLNTPPRFPHAWLEVNDPALQCGRITSFAGFGGEMVPAGKTCLCVEFFCSEKNDLLAEGDDEITQRAVAECEGAGLIDAADLQDSWVMRLARTNAASSWRELQSEERRELLEQLVPLRTFFHTNRPGADWASLSGLLAGQAIVSESREEFDLRADPTRRLPELPTETRASGGPVGEQIGNSVPSARPV